MAHIKPFKFECQKVLPMVFDDALSYYEVLCKVVTKLNEMGASVNEINDALEELIASLPDEIQEKLEEYVHTDEFKAIIEEIVGEFCVTSVNGKTGIVTITGDDIEVSEDDDRSIAEALETAGAVQSVNGNTGAVVLTGEDINYDDDPYSATLAEAIDSRVAKNEESSVHKQIYAKDTDGTQILQNMDSSASDKGAGDVPVRNASGNLETGEPTQNLECATKKYVDENIHLGDSNVNLIDNAWFTINQRGENSYETDEDEYGKYGFDRWVIRTQLTKIEKVSNGVKITNNGSTDSIIDNIFESSMYSYLAGRTLCISYIDGSGIVYHGYGQLPSQKPAIDSDIFKITKSWGEIRLTYLAESIDKLVLRIVTKPNEESDVIIAIKLEIGNKPTIGFDVAPNYQEELLKCQRYFWIYNDNAGFSGIALAKSSGEGFGYFGLIELPTNMRIAPTIQIINAGNIYDSINNCIITSALSYSMQSNKLTIAGNLSNLPTEPYMGLINNTKFSLSAEL